MFWFSGPEACGILAAWPGSEPLPPALESQVSTTKLPGKSPEAFLRIKKPRNIHPCDFS